MLFSCDSEDESSFIVASYKDNHLTLGEVLLNKPSSIDSAIFVKEYIDDWLLNKVIVDKAKLYIDENDKGSFSLSDADGKCIFPVPSIADDKPIQYVNFEVNIDEMIESTQLFGVLPQIQVQSILKVIPPQIFIQISENNLGEATPSPYIQPVIMEFFSQHFSANFVDNNDADLVISGTVNTRSNSDTANDFGIYQVFGDATISISNGETGEEILKKSFNKVQGSDFQSNKEAANQSLKKMSEKIT